VLFGRIHESMQFFTKKSPWLGTYVQQKADYVTPTTGLLCAASIGMASLSLKLCPPCSQAQAACLLVVHTLCKSSLSTTSKGIINPLAAAGFGKLHARCCTGHPVTNTITPREHLLLGKLQARSGRSLECTSCPSHR